MLERKQNENEFEHLLRLSLAKLDKTIDADWQDIVEACGLDIHRDNLRKGAYFMKKYHDYLQDKQPITDDLTEKLLDIKKEKVKLQDLRTSVNKDIRNLGRVENLIDLVKEDINRLNGSKPLIWNEPINLTNSKHAVLLCSDWHIGADFDTMVNSFNKDILTQRVNELINRTIDICLGENVDKVHVASIGDICNGIIKTVTRLENREGIAEQVVFGAELISEMLYTLSQKFALVTYSMTSSNHERIFQDRKENTNVDSFHFFMREMIKLRVGQLSNVVIVDNQLDESMTVLNICNKSVVFSHGDKDKKGTSVSRYSQILGFVPDMICLGHYHSPYEHVEGKTELIVNGSLMGGNQYAVDLRLYSQASQKLLIFSNEYGHESTHIIRFKDKMNTQGV